MRLHLQLDRDLALAMMQAQLDECERHLATRSLIEALRRNAHFEIEQVVRTLGELSRRIRSSVQLVYDGHGTATSGQLTVERDGEPVFEWHLPLGDGPYLAPSDGSDSVFVTTNSALTAIMLYAASIEKLVENATANSDVRSICKQIERNVQRAWQSIEIKSQ